MNSFTLNQLKTRWKNDTFGEIFLDWKWIFSYSRRFKGPIAAYTVLGLLSSTLGLVSSVAGKFLVDVVIGHKTDQLWLAALVMTGAPGGKPLAEIYYLTGGYQVQAHVTCGDGAGEETPLTEEQLTSMQASIDNYLQFLTTGMDTGEYQTNLQNALDALQIQINLLN